MNQHKTSRINIDTKHANGFEKIITIFLLEKKNQPSKMLIPLGPFQLKAYSQYFLPLSDHLDPVQVYSDLGHHHLYQFYNFNRVKNKSIKRE